MYVSLYRKYRPARFEDMFSQEHIRTVLKRQCETGKVSHAYLFCGTRGTGKTTSAKILAKAVNCENPQNGEPCGKCASCISIDNGTATDVIELDAASNNGVDDIRDICEQVVYPPASLKKRVYIIDEVHMLSAGAYNALLKTLEEPPEHVIFILATTELQKIPPTILSRCQRFEFRRIQPEDITACLLSVAGKENINLEKNAAELLAELADGSMRDSLSLLESCVAAGNGDAITVETVSRQLGIAQDGTVAGILKAVAAHDSASALSLLDEYYNSAKSLSLLIEDLVSSIRDILVFSAPGMKLNSLSHLTEEEIKSLSLAVTPPELLYMAEVLEDVQTKLTRYPFNKRMLCEMAIIRLCNSRLSTSPQALLARIAALEAGGTVRKAAPVAKPVPSEEKQNISAAPTGNVATEPQTHPDAADEKPELYDNVPELVDALQSAKNNLGMLLSQSRIYKSGRRIIILGSLFALRIIDDEAKAQIRAALRSLDGVDYEIITRDETKRPINGGSFIDEL